MAQITLNSTGVASNGSLVLQSNGTTAAVTVDTSQNVGVGVTPSAWTRKAIQLGDAAAAYVANNSGGATVIATNMYFDGSNKYATTAAAARYSVGTGTHEWYNAASGTAGNAISFTQAMTLDASGNLGIGTTTPNIGGGTRALTLNTPTGGNYSGVELCGAGTLSARFITNNAAGTFIGSQLSIPLVFETNATERARIDSSGNLLVGTTSSATGNTSTFQSRSATSSDFGLAVTHTSTDDNVRALLIKSPNSSSDDGYFIIGARSTGDRFYVRTSGNVQNTNNSYGAISDVKLKENIVDATPKLEKLNQVRIVNYNLIGESHKQIGVIAQELEAVFPAMVEESLDYEEQIKTREVEVPAVAEVRDDEGNVTTEAVEATTRTEEYTERIALGTKTKSVKYSVFVPMLIKAMQEQQALIAQLQADVAALKGA